MNAIRLERRKRKKNISNVCCEAERYRLEQILLHRQEIVFIFLNESTHSFAVTSCNLNKYSRDFYITLRLILFFISHITRSNLCRIKVKYLIYKKNFCLKHSEESENQIYLVLFCYYNITI